MLPLGALPAIGLGLDIGKGLFQGMLGLGQLFRGNRMKPKRPTYEIPEEAKAQLALDQQLLNARTPGAVQAEQNIAQQQAAAVGNIQQGATDAQTILAVAGATQGTANRAYNNLATMEAQDYQRRLGNLKRSQAQMIAERQRAFQINQYQPFLDATATKAGLTEGGFQNIYGGIGSMAGALGKLHLLQQGSADPSMPAFNPMSMGYGMQMSANAGAGIGGGIYGGNPYAGNIRMYRGQAPFN